MNRIVTVIVVAVITVVAGCAAAAMMDNGGDDKPADNTGAKLEFPGQVSAYAVKLYLSQKGSSERISLDNGGTFDVPEDPIIIVVAANPADTITINGDSVMVEHKDEIFPTTYKCTVAFGQTSSEDPVLIDSTTAYYSFSPKPGETVHLGLFVNST